MSPFDKKTPDNICILNFRPVSILPTFSEIPGTIIKNYIMKSMDNCGQLWKSMDIGNT